MAGSVATNNEEVIKCQLRCALIVPTRLFEPWLLYRILCSMKLESKEVCYAQISGLSKEIGTFLSTFGDLPKPLICALVSFVTLAVTQLTSNISTTTIFLPIVASLVGCS